MMIVDPCASCSARARARSRSGQRRAESPRPGGWLTGSFTERTQRPPGFAPRKKDNAPTEGESDEDCGENRGGLGKALPPRRGTTEQPRATPWGERQAPGLRPERAVQEIPRFGPAKRPRRTGSGLPHWALTRCCFAHSGRGGGRGATSSQGVVLGFSVPPRRGDLGSWKPSPVAHLEVLAFRRVVEKRDSPRRRPPGRTPLRVETGQPWIAQKE
jgi:hypothetical protein